MNKKPVDYKQYDSRWAKKPYNQPGKESDKTIKSSGCGPTCAAMCIATLADKSVTPVETCAWSVKHGFKYADQGTAYGYFVPQLAAYGIDCKQLLSSRIINKPNHPVHDQVKEYLAQGYWVIALMGRKSTAVRGTWTTGGHYILVWDWDNKVRINDPVHASGNNKYCNGDPATFRNEARQYWLVDARKYNGKETDDMTVEEVRKIAEEAAATAANMAFAKAVSAAEKVVADAVSKMVAEVKPTVYPALKDVPSWYAPTIRKLVQDGALKGTGGGALNVSDDFCRIMTTLDRKGKLD